MKIGEDNRTIPSFLKILEFNTIEKSTFIIYNLQRALNIPNFVWTTELVLFIADVLTTLFIYAIIVTMNGDQLFVG